MDLMLLLVCVDDTVITIHRWWYFMHSSCFITSADILVFKLLNQFWWEWQFSPGGPGFDPGHPLLLTCLSFSLLTCASYRSLHVRVPFSSHVWVIAPCTYEFTPCVCGFSPRMCEFLRDPTPLARMEKKKVKSLLSSLPSSSKPCPNYNGVGFRNSISLFQSVMSYLSIPQILKSSHSRHLSIHPPTLYHLQTTYTMYFLNLSS